MTLGRGARYGALAIILLVALAWRLNNIGFGLPSLYDPDEPIFMIKALELLTNGTLNPKWFGHPGSTTIYLLALIDAAVVGSGLASGAYSSVDDFAKAAFADPGLLFIPARTAMALLGVLAVWMTYLVGRRTHGTAVALVAAALLAFNSVHIAWSQVVRTDIHASVFMLASLLFAIRVGQRGRIPDHFLAGLFAGFAVATKWPAVTIFITLLGATASRVIQTRSELKRELIGVIVAGIAVLVGLFVASPFIFLDWQTVLANLSNEARPRHLGHTGAGFLHNGWWYLWHPVRESVGLMGLLLILSGLAVSAVRSRVSRWTLVPAALAFLALIASQNLIWSRWVLPLLPMFSVFAAVAIVALGEAITTTINSRRPLPTIVAVAALAAIPTVAGAFAQSAERANDTRSQAARWAVANIPSGSSVAIEHLELGLREQPWTFLFPIGGAGCVDGVKLLTQGVDYEQVEQLRQGSPIVDFGNVSAERLESCRADYAILTYYDLYLTESAAFPKEIRNYEKLLAGGRTVALFEPRLGHAGGPLVRVVALRQN
jgi:4-amino-4-deoxy-L-arabinose transferase-like glycosyltransferase